MSSMLLKNKIVSAVLVIVSMAAGCSKSVDGPSESTTAATINLNSPQQVIRGFGGVNMPGWIPDMTADQVNKAFGTDSGQIGMTILRIRVPYDSSKFYLEVPAAKFASSLGAIVIASPWTPPAWMKSNNNIVGGTLQTGAYAAYAAHLKSFGDYMASNGVPLYAVSIQNEPDVSVTYESCDWNSAQMINFLKYAAPSIGTKIIVPESYNGNRVISDAILNDPAAAANVSIIGVHIYGGGRTRYPLAASKGKEVWMTEHLVTDTIWAGALETAGEIHDCMDVGMNAYLWWYIRRFYGPIDDNSNVTKRGYAMSQFARFVRPGFVKVDATAKPQSYIYVTAYKNNSNVVIVALNFNSSPLNQTFEIQNGTVNTFTPYVTSSTQNCSQGSTVAVSGGSFTVVLGGESVTTFVSN